MNNETLKKQLDEFLQIHYNGSFSRMVCDYIHARGMTEEEVEALLEAMKDSKSMKLTEEDSHVVAICKLKD
ncbi:MAG: hypothetical protein IJZ38_07545 [Bacteroides sp.]|nr:hypothetical protein [Bacteroides sp.]